MPLSVQNDSHLEVTDKSLFKRLQYAKEILVQMMSVASMPATLALHNSNNEAEEELKSSKVSNYVTQKAANTAVSLRRATDGSRTA